MNTHPTELLPGYVLGVLDEQATQHVAAHIEQCLVCQAEAESFRASMQAVKDATCAVPPAHIKRQLMARVQLTKALPDRPHPGASFATTPLWVRGLVGCLLLVVLVLGLFMAETRRQLVEAQRTIQAQQADIQSKDQAITAFLSNPATVGQPMDGVAPGVTAQMYMQAGHTRAVLLVAGLPMPEPGTTYQFWFANGTQQIASGTFSADTNGNVEAVFDAPSPVSSYGEVMVTVEPAGGSVIPSNNVVLAARLAA